jgi:hypothetical protein
MIPLAQVIGFSALLVLGIAPPEATSDIMSNDAAYLSFLSDLTLGAAALILISFIATRLLRRFV